MRNQLLILGFFALFGVFLMQGGITGYAVAEECLEHGVCPEPEYKASFERPAFLNSGESNALSIVGLLITLISVMLIIGYLRINIKKKQALKKQ